MENQKIQDANNSSCHCKPVVHIDEIASSASVSNSSEKRAE